MRQTRVKICGVTRPEDAALAAACGAYAVGMIFHPSSPRNISIETARRILATLPPSVTPVGLFVDSSKENIQSVVSRLGLRHVQLHGNESPQFAASLEGLFIVKAVRVVAGAFIKSLDLWRGSTTVGALVLETGGTRQPGGTGIANNWDLVREHLDAGDFEGLPPIIAAGGLTPNNVGGVVRSIRPWAVDVSSGVECVHGQKSEKLMREFFDAVRRADEP
jgi:phosphoribosylanthranilate isomerase